MLIQLLNVSLSNLITVSSPEEAIWSLSQLTWFLQLFQSHTAKDNLEVDFEFVCLESLCFSQWAELHFVLPPPPMTGFSVF